MFIKNLKYAFRNLWRDKFYTLLNGVGLTIGIAGSMLIFLWVSDELSFDNFHTKGDRIYRVMGHWSFGGKKEMIATAPFPLIEATKSRVPEVEKITFTGELWSTIIRHGDKRIEAKKTYLVNKDFFEIFDFPVLYGDVLSAISSPTNVILTESMAKQIYGTADVLGQPLELVDKMDLIVGAVLADVPSNSHINFNMLIPFEGNINKFYNDGGLHWGAFNFDSYVMLRPGIDADKVSKKLSDLIPVEEGEESAEDRTTFSLQALSDIYLGSGALKRSRAPRGNLKTIWMIGIIGLLILLIACINYINMTTARAAHRTKSIGVRKIVGASRWQLFNQLMLEIIVLVSISSFSAFVLANLSLSVFEELSGKHIVPDQLLSVKSIAIFMGTAITAILLAGIQPALQLSAFRPLQALRGSNFKGISGRGNLRKILVTTQFAYSGALIISTLVMLIQMDFVKKQKLGYEREQIFTFRCNDSDVLIFKNELMSQPGVLNVTGSNNMITNINNRFGGFNFEGKDKDLNPSIYQISVEESFPDFFGLSLKEGRWFLPGNRDSSSFILNETAITKLGIEDPIGKWMNFNGIKGQIAGVTKDFHFRSFHHEIEPLIIIQDFRWGMKRLYVKTTGEEAASAIAAVQEKFNTLEPNAIFSYTFLDESYDKLYKTEEKSSKLLGLFAGLAILISCLGIFGLAAYTAERRRKEIGIRKVLGATILNIVTLISNDFIKLVLFALLFAFPVAWYLMEQWLQDFAYRIEIEWWVFAIAAFLSLSIAFVTVSFQSIKAAITNPVNSIKSE